MTEHAEDDSRSSPAAPANAYKHSSTNQRIDTSQAEQTPIVQHASQETCGIGMVKPQAHVDQAPGPNATDPFSSSETDRIPYGEVTDNLLTLAKQVAANARLLTKDKKDAKLSHGPPLTPNSSRDGKQGRAPQAPTRNIAGIRAIYSQVRHIKSTRPIVDKADEKQNKFFNTVHAIRLATRHINMERSIATYLAEAATESKRLRERVPPKVENRGLSVFDAQVQRLALNRGDYLADRNTMKAMKRREGVSHKCKGTKILNQLVQELADAEETPESLGKENDKQQAAVEANVVVQLRSEAAELLVAIKAIPPSWHGRLAEEYKSAEAAVRKAQVLTVDFEGAVTDLIDTLQVLVGCESSPFCAKFHSMQRKPLPQDTEICDACNAFVSIADATKNDHAWYCDACPTQYFLCQDCGDDRLLSLFQQALRELPPADGWSAAIKRAQGCLKFGSGIPKGAEVYTTTVGDMLAEQAALERNKTTKEKVWGRAASIASRKFSIASTSSHSNNQPPSEMFVFLQGKTCRRMSQEGLHLNGSHLEDAVAHATADATTTSPKTTPKHTQRQSLSKVCRGRPSIRECTPGAAFEPVVEPNLEISLRRADTSVEDHDSSVTDEHVTTPAGDSIENDQCDVHTPKMLHVSPYVVRRAIPTKTPSPSPRPQRRIHPPRRSAVQIPAKRQVHVSKSRHEQVMERYAHAVADGEKVARRLMPKLSAEASQIGASGTDSHIQDGKQGRGLQHSPAAVLEAWSMARLLLAQDLGVGCPSTPDNAKAAFGTVGELDVHIWRATVAAWGRQLEKYIDACAVAVRNGPSLCSAPFRTDDAIEPGIEELIVVPEHTWDECSPKMPQKEQDTLQEDIRSCSDASEVGSGSVRPTEAARFMSSFDGGADARTFLDLDGSLTPDAMKSSAIHQEEHISIEGGACQRPQSSMASSRLRDLPDYPSSSQLSNRTWAPASPIDRMPTPGGRRPRTGDYWSRHRRDHIKDRFPVTRKTSTPDTIKDDELQDFKVLEIGLTNFWRNDKLLSKPQCADGRWSKRLQQSNIAEAILETPRSVKGWLGGLNRSFDIPDLPCGEVGNS